MIIDRGQAAKSGTEFAECVRDMKKVVFLKVARSPPAARGGGDGSHATALVLQKSADGYLTIQGRAPVAWAERHQCWQLFRVSFARSVRAQASSGAS